MEISAWNSSYAGNDVSGNIAWGEPCDPMFSCAGRSARHQRSPCWLTVVGLRLRLSKRSALSLHRYALLPTVCIMYFLDEDYDVRREYSFYPNHSSCWSSIAAICLHTHILFVYYSQQLYLAIIIIDVRVTKLLRYLLLTCVNFLFTSFFFIHMNYRTCSKCNWNELAKRTEISI